MTTKDKFKDLKEATEREFEKREALTIYEKFNYFILKIFFSLEDENIVDAVDGLGSNDRGADAIFYDDDNQKIHICQFKTTDIDSSKSIESLIPTELDKLSNFEKKINIPSKNERVETERLNIQGKKEDNYEVELHYFYMGIKKPEEKLKQAESLKINLYSFDDIYNKYLEYKDNGEIENDETKENNVEGRYTLYGANFSKVKTSNERSSYIGIVEGESLIKLHNDVKAQNPEKSSLSLYNNNVRYKLGTNKVHKAIEETAKSKPDLFYYYNNGITITCKKCEIKEDSIIIDSPSVINGAQTINTLVNAKITKANLSKILILCKVIQRKDGDRTFIKDLTKYNNFSNQVKDFDFLANNKEQTALYKKFKDIGIFYEHKRGLRHTDEYKKFNRQIKDFNYQYYEDLKVIKLTIQSLLQILIAVRGEPHKSKNIKEVLSFEISKNIDEENKKENEETYFKTLFEIDTKEDVLKKKDESEGKKFSKTRFFDIVLSVFIFVIIKKNIDAFRKQKEKWKDLKWKDLEAKSIFNEIPFLKNVPLGENNPFQTFSYIVDSSYLILSALSYAFKNETVGMWQKFKKQLESCKDCKGYDNVYKQISETINSKLCDFLEVCFNPIVEEIERNKDNIKNFTKNSKSFGKIKEKINNGSGRNHISKILS
jgi:hypothetical protein